MIEPFYDELAPVIESIAAEYGRRYHQYGSDREDFANDCWLWVYDHPAKVAEFFANGTDDGVKLLARTLRNELLDIGENAKAQHTGYSRDDLAYYNKTYLRELLPMVYDEEAWIHPEQGDGERRAPSDPATGGNWITTLADVSQALSKLTQYDQDLLAAFHRDDYPNKVLAVANGISEQTMSYRHDRAIGRLLKQLGGHKPRPQHDEGCDHYGRRAVSNAAARAYQQSMYEED